MNNTKLIIITMLLTLSSVFTAATSSAQSDILADLDRTLDSSQSFVDAHSLNIKGIEDMLRSDTTSATDSTTNISPFNLIRLWQCSMSATAWLKP